MSKEPSATPANNQRRQLLQGAIAATALAGASTIMAAESHKHGANKNKGLAETAAHCVVQGQACMDHCMELFKTGDTSVANCADTVNEMLAMCSTLSKMASYQSAHLATLAKVCIAVCEDCERECNEHKEHAECKACAEACKECIKACKKVAA